MKYAYAQVTLNGKHWGLIDRAGEYVIPPNYQHIHQWTEGTARLVKRSSDVVVENGIWVNKYNGEIYFIDYKGEFITNDSFDYALDFSEGLAAVVKNGKWGFISKEGAIVNEYTFENAYGFHEGLCAVSYDGQWGFIDQDGEWMIESVYDSVQSFKYGLAVVEKEGRYKLINMEGETVAHIPEEYPWVSVKSKNIILYGTTSRDIGIRRYGFMDSKGHILSSPTFYIESEYQFDLFDYSDGMLIVSDEDELYGYLNEAGQLAIPCQYEAAEPFIKGYAKVTSDGISYRIDKNGQRVKIETENYPFDEVQESYEGLAAARIGDKWGFINQDGEVVIDFKYYDYPAHKEGIPAGDYLAELNPKFSSSLLPIIRSDGGKYSSGFIDQYGDEAIPFDFLLVSSFEEAD